MAQIIADLIAGRRKCSGLEGRLRDLPRWRPQLKRLVAEAIAECIVEVLGEENVEEIYMVDLAGGEFVPDFTGRDIDLVVLVSDRFLGMEGDLKKALETMINKELEQMLGWYIAETGKRELAEIHVVTSLDMGYGRLVKSKFYPAIRVWARRRGMGQGQVFPFPF